MKLENQRRKREREQQERQGRERENDPLNLERAKTRIELLARGTVKPYVAVYVL